VIKKNLLLVLSVFFFSVCIGQDKNLKIRPGEKWPDSDGNHINAHGGGILLVKGTYYWFGESRLKFGDPDRSDYGVGCYSSKDLVNWKNEGLALRIINDTASLLQPGSVIERPKVLFNKKTGKYVMWFHHELKGQGYKAAMTGVAVSDNVTGPYRYFKSIRPNAGVWPVNFTEEQKKTFLGEGELKSGSSEWKDAVRAGLYVRRDFTGGQMARDMTLFVDTDGRAWHIHSSEENMTLHFSELTDDYLDFTGVYYRVLPGDSNEAPALFKANGKYFLFTSGTTGWRPNPGRLATSGTITGEWKPAGNPCRGTEEQNKVTFSSQSTFVLQPDRKKNIYIFMADRWNPSNLAESRHIWLPVEWENGMPVLKWKDEFNIKKFK
jgi:hypothetical protein